MQLEQLPGRKATATPKPNFAQWRKQLRGGNGQAAPRSVVMRRDTGGTEKPDFARWREQLRGGNEKNVNPSAVRPEDTTNTEKPDFAQWRRQLRQKHPAIQSWVEETTSLIEDVKKQSEQWFDTSAYEAQKVRIANLTEQAEFWRGEYAHQESALETIDRVVAALEDTEKYIATYWNHYDQWDSIDAYNSWLEEQALIEKSLSYDFEGGRRALEEAMAISEQYAREVQRIGEYRLAPEFSDLDAVTFQQIDQWLKEIEQRYGITAEKSFSDVLDEMNAEYDLMYQVNEDYKQSIQEAQELEELESMDLDRFLREVEQMESDLKEYGRIESWLESESANALTPEYIEILRGNQQELLQKYGVQSSKEMSDLLTQSKWKLNRGKRVQQYTAMNGVADPNSEFYDPRFQTLSQYKPKTAPYMNGGELGTDYMDLAYEFINGNPNVSELTVGIDKNYFYINDKERSIYNYLYAEEGREKAEEYLTLLQETFNERSARDRFAKMEDRTYLEIAFGIEAGLDRFVSGIKNSFNFSDAYIPVSDTQMLSGMVREDLSDDGFKLPAFLGGASIGQVAYDVVNSTAYALPSTLTKLAVNSVAPGAGTAIGLGMQGIASVGNAYQEMLNLGYDKGQARTYSTLVGAAETALSAIFEHTDGRVKKVFDGSLKAADNALGRLGIRLGKMLIPESTEEMLTEVMIPVLRNGLMGTDEKIDLEQVLYAGLLGAITATAFKGVELLGRGGKASVNPNADTSNPDTLGAYSVCRYLRGLGKVLTDSDAQRIAQILTDEGMRSEDAESLIQAVGAVIDGADLTNSQRKALEVNDVLAHAIVDVMATGASNAKADMQGDSTVSNVQTTNDLTDRDILSQVLASTDLQTVDPRLRPVLRDYGRHLQQLKTIESLQQKQQAKIAQLQKSGSSANDLQTAQRDLAKLEQMHAQQLQRLDKIKDRPEIKQFTAQTLAQRSSEAVESIENRRNGELDFPDIHDTINIDASSLDEEGFVQVRTLREKRAEILKRNRSAGSKTEVMLFAIFDRIMDKLESQVTIKINGVKGKIRVDAIGFEKTVNGKYILKILEFKSSRTAQLTKNQRDGFPMLPKNGGVVVRGKRNDVFFKSGYVIPPGTEIEVIRIDEGGNWYVSDRFG